MDEETFQMALVPKWINDDFTSEPVEQYVRVVYGVEEVDLNTATKETETTTEDVPGVPCEPEDFSALKKQSFEDYGLRKGYCPPKKHRDTPFSILG